MVYVGQQRWGSDVAQMSSTACWGRARFLFSILEGEALRAKGIAHVSGTPKPPTNRTR